MLNTELQNRRLLLTIQEMSGLFNMFVFPSIKLTLTQWCLLKHCSLLIATSTQVCLQLVHSNPFTIRTAIFFLLFIQVYFKHKNYSSFFYPMLTHMSHKTLIPCMDIIHHSLIDCQARGAKQITEHLDLWLNRIHVLCVKQEHLLYDYNRIIIVSGA